MDQISGFVSAAETLAEIGSLQSLSLSLNFLSAACNPNLCRAKGRGLQPKGLRVKETADFKVYTKGAGTGELKVSIKGPSEFQYTNLPPQLRSDQPNVHEIKGDLNIFAEGLEEPCKRKDLGDGVYGFEYYPTSPGTYSITITWGGQHIPRRYSHSNGHHHINLSIALILVFLILVPLR